MAERIAQAAEEVRLSEAEERRLAEEREVA